MFTYVDNEKSAKIKVIGVGGAGGNAINNMIASNLQGVKFIAANTDAQALEISQAPIRIQLGEGITKNYDETFKWFQMAAKQGHTDAQFKLGMMYNMGLSVKKDDSEEYKELLENVKKGQPFDLTKKQLIIPVERGGFVDLLAETLNVTYSALFEKDKEYYAVRLLTTAPPQALKEGSKIEFKIK